jgi:hypothetical protein
MTEAFFNLTKTTFSKDISEDPLYETPQFMELQARLTYTATKRLFMIVTGDAGSGKTTCGTDSLLLLTKIISCLSMSATQN